jgi:hypothetical protein
MAEIYVQRFWHSPEIEPTLDEDGFLRDPLAHDGWTTNVKAVDPSDIPPCLVLLGEPGTGKTVVLEVCRTEAGKAGRRAVPIDLRAIDRSRAWLHSSM